MPECTIDAIKIAKAIQEDELSILDGKEFKMSDKIKKRKRMKKTRKKGNKYTLNQLGNKVDKLTTRVDQLTTRVDQLTTRVDQLTTTVDKLAETVAILAKTVDDGFKELRNDIKGINTRLDYIVSANNLKDLPNNRKI